MRDPQKKYEKFMAKQKAEQEAYEELTAALENFKAVFYDAIKAERICDWLTRLLERRHRHGHK